MSRAYGYAWIIRGTKPGDAWELCQWAEPSIEQLEARSKPSPEAQAVRVEIIPTRASVRNRRLRPNLKVKAQLKAKRER